MKRLWADDPIEQLGEWPDAPGISDRANDLMRENWHLLNECVRMYNAGELADPDALEDFRDLIGQSLAIERKYAEVRQAEFAETQRRWYTRAFGPDYERVLGWDQTSSSRSRRIS